MTYHAVNAHNVMCPHSHHHVTDAIDCIRGFEVPCGRVIDSVDRVVATVTDRETWIERDLDKAKQPAPTFEEERRRYNEAADRFVPALLIEAVRVIRDAIPNAATISLLGEYNEEMERTLRIQEVRNRLGVIEASVDDPGVETEEAINEADSHFDYLTHLTGDDYLGKWTLDVETLSFTRPS